MVTHHPLIAVTAVMCDGRGAASEVEALPLESLASQSARGVRFVTTLHKTGCLVVILPPSFSSIIHRSLPYLEGFHETVSRTEILPSGKVALCIEYNPIVSSGFCADQMVQCGIF